MRRRKRVDAGSPMSFFAFQDIITAVSGIMVFILLMLSLRLLLQHAAASDSVQGAVDLKTKLQDEQARRRRLVADQDALRRSLAAADGRTAAELKADIARLEQKRRQAAKQAADAARELAGLSKSSSAAGLRQTLAEARAALAAAEQRHERARREARQAPIDKRLTYLPAVSDGKKPVLLQCQADAVLAAPADTPLAARVFRGAGKTLLAQVLAYASTFDRSGFYFVILIRPSAIDMATQLTAGLKALGYSVGYDPLGRSETILAPGASGGD